MSTSSKRPLVVFLAFWVLFLVPDRGAAQPQAESTFDGDSDGWETGGSGTTVQHVSSGGRPGGYVEAQAQNEGEIWYWSAPSAFTGDFSNAYNGALRFDLTQDTTEAPLDSADVILEGATDTLTAAVANPPTSDWTAYRLPLRPAAGWTLQESGEVPTTTEMIEVLASLENVRIRGNYWSEGGTVGLDNVRLQAAQTVERWVDPTQTYLQTDADDEANDAIAINLSNLGLSPGDQIHVAQLGEFDFDPTEENTTLRRMVAVFSGSSVLESSEQVNRVPDAIDAGEDFDTGSLSADIPEDFLVDEDTVEIPTGATHLFLSGYDGNFEDNVDPDGDYKLRITLPEPPSGLTVDATADSVALQWDPSSFGTLSEYRIYRDTAPIDSTAGPGAYSVLTTALEANYIDESVTVGETYHYRLTAVDNDGNESSFSIEARATPGTLPSPPSNVQSEVTGDSSAAVQWLGVTDAEKYRLYRDTEPITGDPSARAAYDSTQVGVTEYVDTGLTPGETYYYRVTAVDVEADESEYSAEVTARPPLSVIALDDAGTVAQADTTTLDVLANDVQGKAPIDTSLLRIDENSSHGRATINRDAGTIDYAHDGTDTFQDSFTYIVEDTDEVADTARVTISVQEVTLTAERDSLEVGAGQVGTLGPTARLEFTSTGDVAARGLSVTLSDSVDYKVVEDTGEDVLEPGESRTVQVGFQPEEAGAGQTTSVTLTTKTGIESTVVLRGDGVSAQVETSAAEGVVTQGEPVLVNVTPEGPLNPTSRLLYVRRSGGAYQQLEDPQGIPASFVTERGVDYYVVLRQGDVQVVLPGGSESAARRNPFHLSVRFDSLSASLSLRPESYRMVSVPARTEIKQALERSYGGYDRSLWRMLRWSPSAEAYREFPNVDSLEAGMGFWLITSSGEAFSLGEGRSVDASTPQHLVLESGWNQVGTPFNFSVPWDTVQSASGLSDVQIDGPIAYRDGEGYQPGQSVLKPWHAYFVFNATGERDTLVVPPVGTDAETTRGAESGPTALADSRLWGDSSSAGPADDDTGPGAEDETEAAGTGAKQAGNRPYTLRVTAQSKDEQAGRVWLGLRSAAKVGRDALDVAQAPPVGQTVRLSVQETIKGRSVSHAGSFKPPEGKGRTWTLVLRRPAAGPDGSAQPVRLRMEDEGALPDRQTRYVLDLDEERRLVSGQTLTMKPGERRRLKVIVGTKAFAQKNSDGIALEHYENDLRGNAPNPFSGETTLTYVLEQKVPVTLEVYNVLGQRVRTLVEERKEAGVHHVRWNGQNQLGEPVGSGVYFYRIEAGDFRETRKMVLVR